MRMMQSPIILVGTQRSGTTWLTRVFAHHPELACWMEPRYVWSWGNNYRPDDVLTAANANPKVVKHIRQRFQQFVEYHGKARVFEKTPSNCLRLPFINQVFPEAKIIHIIRDGRAVFSSTNNILEMGFYRPDKFKGRFSEMLRETPIPEWPAYWPRIQETLASKLLHKPLPFWGPRPPGWKDWLDKYPPPVIIAQQWVATVSKAVEDGNKLSPSQYYRFKYEDLISEPKETITSIIEFTELSSSQPLIDYAVKTADPSRQKSWENVIDSGTLQQVRPYLEKTLNTLGYGW